MHRERRQEAKLKPTIKAKSSILILALTALCFMLSLAPESNAIPVATTFWFTTTQHTVNGLESYLLKSAYPTSNETGHINLLGHAYSTAHEGYHFFIGIKPAILYENGSINWLTSEVVAIASYYDGDKTADKTFSTWREWQCTGGEAIPENASLMIAVFVNVTEKFQEWNPPSDFQPNIWACNFTTNPFPELKYLESSEWMCKWYIYYDYNSLFDIGTWTIYITGSAAANCIENVGIAHFLYHIYGPYYEDGSPAPAINITFQLTGGGQSTWLLEGELHIELFSLPYSLSWQYVITQKKLQEVIENGNGTTIVKYPNGTVREVYNENSTETRIYIIEEKQFSRYFRILSQSEEIYVFISKPTTRIYEAEIRDYIGLNPEDSSIETILYLNGTTFTVERKPISTTRIPLVLQQGTVYSIRVKSQTYGVYDFGMIIPGESTILGPFQITALSFPSQVYYTFKYVRFHAYRNESGTGITFMYQDTLMMTNQISLTIKYPNGTVYYTITSEASSLSVTVPCNRTITYFVEASSQHEKFGTLTWSMVLAGALPTAEFIWEPISILGTFPISTGYIIPLIILFAMIGCFSTLSSSEGTFLTILVACLMWYMGWLPLSYSAVVIMICLAIIYHIYKSKEKERVII